MYGLYGSTPSLFTRKLEAALIFYRAPFEFISKPSHPDPKGLEARVGTHQVPVLQTPEDWVIADTTPIIEMLDHRFPQRRLFPPGPLGVIAHLVEECLDEWVARVMVHYRWHYPDSAAFASEVIADGDPVRAHRNRLPSAGRRGGIHPPVGRRRGAVGRDALSDGGPADARRLHVPGRPAGPYPARP
jgi:glutathione S-transferase